MEDNASMLFTSGFPQQNAAHALAYWEEHPSYSLYESPGARAYWVGPESDATLAVWVHRWRLLSIGECNFCERTCNTTYCRMCDVRYCRDCAVDHPR